MKALKAAGLVAIEIGFLQTDKHGAVAHMLHALRSPVLDRAFAAAVNWLASLSPGVRGLLDVGTFLYAALFAVEAVGLWMRKHWAEWLTVVTTALLIPFEIYEIVRKPAWERVALFVLNVSIVVYLVARIRCEMREGAGDRVVKRPEERTSFT